MLRALTAGGVLIASVAACSAVNPDFEPQTQASGSSGSMLGTTGASQVDSTGGIDASTGGGLSGPDTGTAPTGGSGEAVSTGIGRDTGSESGDPLRCVCDSIQPCPDNLTDTPHQALGVDCADIPVSDATTFAAVGAVGVIGWVGSTAAFDPTQGSAYAVMGTGPIDRLDDPQADCEVGVGFGPGFEIGPIPPAPMISVNAGGDCGLDPGLVGFGDCSNTLGDQLFEDLFDYADLQWTMTVPQGADAVAVDYALLISEYPEFVNTASNDMFVVWLESELWTGNIALDGQGNPLSVISVELDYEDDDGLLPELQGTCMQGHGATAWLSGSGPVMPGEEIRMAAALWDGGDGAFDAYALVDGFRWECGGC